MLFLLQLHGPNGQIIDVNPNEITSLRSPQAGSENHFGKNVHCLIKMTNGAVNAVVEDCEWIRVQLERIGR